MSLIEQLRNVGQQLGLVKVVAGNSSSTSVVTLRKLTTRTITLKELDAEIEAQQLKTLSELPADALIDIEQVLAAAGIKTDPNAWSVARLAHVINSDSLKGHDRKHIQAAILNQLAADKATIEDIVKDAIARDHAIDAYDAIVHKKIDERAQLRQRRSAEIQDQIKSLQEEAGRLAHEARLDEQHFKTWHRKKIACETDMAQVINYLLEKPVITIEDE